MNDTASVPTVAKKPTFSVANLKSGLASVGAGGSGGGQYLTINHKTGKVTIGKDAVYEPTWETAVRVETIRYGYFTFPAKGAPTKDNMVAMVTGAPKPTPPAGEGYASYPEPGHRDMTELVLNPMQGSFKGESIEFAPTSVSSQNRIANLIDAVVRQSELPAGVAGYMHPIILVKSDFWNGDYGDIHHFDYTIVDWLDDSGEHRASNWEGAAEEEEVDDFLAE